MIVIGFNWPIEHDNAVAVIQDGELVFAAEEERFTRHKHSPGEPALNSLKQAYKYLLRRGIKPKDVDAYAVNFDPSLYIYKSRLIMSGITYKLSVAHEIIKGIELPNFSWNIIRGDYLILAKRLITKAISDLGEEVPSDIKIYPVRHHLTHAASAYYFSGFNSATIITIDGYGEYEAIVIWKVNDGEFEPVLSMLASYGSLGLLYEEVSEKISLGRLEGPGKAMGLAPYGRMSNYYNKLKSFVKITPDGDEPFFIADGKKNKD